MNWIGSFSDGTFSIVCRLLGYRQRMKRSRHCQLTSFLLSHSVGRALEGRGQLAGRAGCGRLLVVH